MRAQLSLLPATVENENGKFFGINSPNLAESKVVNPKGAKEAASSCIFFAEREVNPRDFGRGFVSFFTRETRV